PSAPNGRLATQFDRLDERLRVPPCEASRVASSRERCQRGRSQSASGRGSIFDAVFANVTSISPLTDLRRSRNRRLSRDHAADDGFAARTELSLELALEMRLTVRVLDDADALLVSARTAEFGVHVVFGGRHLSCADTEHAKLLYAEPRQVSCVDQERRHLVVAE